MTRFEKRIHSKEVLNNLVGDILSYKISPTHVWSERTYCQDIEESSLWYRNNDNEIFGKVWNFVKELLTKHNINIYLNHIVFEFPSNDEIIYLGLNDGMLCISTKIGTIGGKRIEIL